MGKEEDKEVNLGGRPPYEPSEKEQGALEALLAVGFPHRQIALYMGKDIKTLRKYYPETFSQNTREDKTALVENALWYNAVYKMNFMAQIAWLRAHKPEIYNDKDKNIVDNAANNEFLGALAGVLSNAHKSAD